MSETKCVLGSPKKPIRFSYAHVFEKHAMENSKGEKSDPKYSVSILIPKSDTALVERIKAAIKAATDLGVETKYKGKKPNSPTFKNPLHDGDLERSEKEEYEGMYFVNASTDNQPDVVDSKLNAITSKDVFYSGCFGLASVNFFPFNSNGSIGVGCGLRNVMKTKDGEKFGSGASAAEDFRDISGDEDFDDQATGEDEDDCL